MSQPQQATGLPSEDLSSCHTIMRCLFEAAQTSQKDRFERKGAKITPAIAIICVMYFSSLGCNTGLEGLMTSVFISLGGIFGWKDVPASSTICRARDKLTQEMFDAFQIKLILLTGRISSDILPRVRGYRIIAIDGSWISVPNSKMLRRLLGVHRIGPKKCPMGHPQVLMVVLTDALTRMPIARVYLPGIGSEREAAKVLMKFLKPDDILVADRGYQGREMLAAIHETGCRYVLRICGGRNAWKEFRPYQRQRCRDSRVNVTWQAENISVRHVRISGGPGRPRKNSRRETMYLITNLPKSWSLKKIELLYRSRWGIETMFRELKATLETGRIRSRSLKGVKLELDARCLHLTLAVLIDLMSISQHKKQAKSGVFTYKTNRTTLLEIVRLIITSYDKNGIEERIEIAIATAARRAQRIRLGRFAPRRKKMFGKAL